MADPVRYEDLPTAYVFNASMSMQTLQVMHLPLQQALHSQLHQSLSTAAGGTSQASLAELNDAHRHGHAAVEYHGSREAANGSDHLTVSNCLRAYAVCAALPSLHLSMCAHCIH